MPKPSPKDLFRGLDAKAAPRLVKSGAVAIPGEAPRTAADTAAVPVPVPAPRQRSRQGKKIVTYYLDPEPFTQLKVLSAKKGLTVQELNLEALNLLFEKHQVSRIAR
jgi:hypothetical protein